MIGWLVALPLFLIGFRHWFSAKPKARPRASKLSAESISRFQLQREAMSDTQLFDHFLSVLRLIAKEHPETFGQWTVDFLARLFKFEPRSERLVQQAFLYVQAARPMTGDEIERLFNTVQHGN